MKIHDFERVSYDVEHDRELESVLAKRYLSGTNEFWLYDSGQQYPTLSILVKDDLAGLHYFPHEGHPGFRSVGDLRSQGTTIFPTRAGTDSIELLNEALVPFSSAILAAREFLARESFPPPSIKWLEL